MFRPDGFDDRETMRVFHVELEPWLKHNGPKIGDKAMQGDLEAENLIRRYAVFVAWKDPENLKLLRSQMKNYERKL